MGFGYGVPLGQPARRGTDPVPKPFSERVNLGEWLTDASAPLVSRDPAPPAPPAPAPAPATMPAPPQAAPRPPAAHPSTPTPRPPSGRDIAPAAHAVAQHYAETRETGKPKSSGVRVQLPGGEWVEYGPETEAQVRGAAASPEFVTSRRGQPVPGSFDAEVASSAGDTARVVRGPAGATGGHSETFRTSTRAESVLDWNRFKTQRERETMAEGAERAGVEAATQGARAAAARSSALVDDPFLAENLEARARIGAKAIEAETEASRRESIRATMAGANAQINDLWTNPRYANLTPAQKKQAEDRIMLQVELALGALTRTNLSPRLNPLEGLVSGIAGGQQQQKE